jgi:endonuclease G
MHTSFKKELRYGVPAADQILYNRYYTVGYSYYFRQPKWALEIVNPSSDLIERLDNFRPDLRIRERFRADLVDYQNSGQNRGHLVASANQIGSDIQNSETFLLSNIYPAQRLSERTLSTIRKLNVPFRRRLSGVHCHFAKDMQGSVVLDSFCKIC